MSSTEERVSRLSAGWLVDLHFDLPLSLFLSRPPECDSPSTGLTTFGRELVQECERLGILLDLAHINPAGFEEIFSLTTRPLIVSHSNARRYHEIERNISDEQIKMIDARGGVIGIDAILVSAEKEETTPDRYIDHIEHVASRIGIDGVGIGFDFCESLWRQMPVARREELEARLRRPHFLPGNWLRVLQQML